MINLPENINSLSLKHGFTRSAMYDQGWMFDNAMGPNPLWLMEWLSKEMHFSENMVVLDMGCGKAMTSIFLAKEFGCTVFANDLWIPADDNRERIEALALGRKVFPIHAEAHDLPYAHNFFDAITCIDAYQYFGTDDLYLSYFTKFVKPGGQIGIVFPGWLKERKGFKLPSDPDGEISSFHTPEWWNEHFQNCPLVDVEKCDVLPNGKTIWLDSAKAKYETIKIIGQAKNLSAEQIQQDLDFWKVDINFINDDKDNYIGLFKIILRRKK